MAGIGSAQAWNLSASTIRAQPYMPMIRSGGCPQAADPFNTWTPS